ncbi:GGL domain protein [Onchocerca flexuosa]|uniref:Guanine nucleotide-binding protein subunit gamma n=1 Tax=Onchocerca flexuosa TaxID=387005 RepID=A0A238BZ33_9BILA|nr:GGL domain protein [Onchocerca flexuosa]
MEKFARFIKTSKYHDKLIFRDSQAFCGYLGEMDKGDMQRSVESLRHQLNIQRLPVSQSANEIKRYIEGQQENDPLVNPVDKRCNPWAEKSKCEIL